MPETNGSMTLLTEEQTLISLYENVNPSVVSIQVFSSGSLFGESELPEGHPSVPGFPTDPQETDPTLPYIQQAQGSGFIYSSDGYIVTNNHVVSGADAITVVFYEGTEADATLVGTDPDSDLAVIKVEDVNSELLQPVPLGDSDALKVGQFVVAIGNPFGLANSMTTGIVSGLGRTLPAESTTPDGTSFNIPAIIQTDAAINPGNSGGPLLNLQGEVIGVNTAIESPVEGFAGVAYAIPAKTVWQVVPQLIANGRIQHPWLGILGGTLDNDLAEAMNLAAGQRGVIISEVVQDGPAAKAGLRGGDADVQIDGLTARIGGDIIVAIDEQPVMEFDDLLTYIVQETGVGQTVTIVILRDGEQQTIDVTLEARPSN
ncbi:MAG: trypsin-like peptidase domain-containing protein [Chloroflexota bacterium]